MKDTNLKVTKTEHEVSLWVTPDGMVKGSLFLLEQSEEHGGREEPVSVLNQDTSFVVVRLHNPEQLRFYNRTSIIRVEYPQPDQPDIPDGTTVISCTIYTVSYTHLTLPTKRIV